MNYREEMFDSKQPVDFESLTEEDISDNGMIPLDCYLHSLCLKIQNL